MSQRFNQPYTPTPARARPTSWLRVQLWSSLTSRGGLAEIKWEPSQCPPAWLSSPLPPSTAPYGWQGHRGPQRDSWENQTRSSTAFEHWCYIKRVWKMCCSDGAHAWLVLGACAEQTHRRKNAYVHAERWDLHQWAHTRRSGPWHAYKHVGFAFTSRGRFWPHQLGFTSIHAAVNAYSFFFKTVYIKKLSSPMNGHLSDPDE